MLPAARIERGGVRRQVIIQSLKKVDMAALIGQTSSTAVAIRGSATSRRVTCYSSHPEELQARPSLHISM
jgi:hypothetical protein